MAYEKAAFTGLALAIAGLFTYGGFQGHKLREGVQKSKAQMENVGVSPKQIKQIEEKIGALDLADHFLGESGDQNKALEWEKVAKYMEQKAHINKVQIKNINVNKVAQEVIKGIK